MLMINRPNWFSPIFSQVGNMIKYKRFPADYMERDFLDLQPLVDGIEALGTEVTSLQTDVTALQTEVAQIENTLGRDFALFADQFSIIGETTHAYSLSTNHRYNFVRYSVSLATNWRGYASADMSAGGNLIVLYMKAPNGGKMDVRIDGELIGQINLYDAANVYNQEAQLTVSASLITTGRHQIDLISQTGGQGGNTAINMAKLWFIGS